LKVKTGPILEDTYSVVSYGSYQSGDLEGLRKHGVFRDVEDAVKMAKLVVESSLRHDAATSTSAQDLAKRYSEYGIVPVIWGNPAPNFNPQAYAQEAATEIWEEYIARLARHDARSPEIEWERSKARGDKVLLVRAMDFAAKKHRAQRNADAGSSPYINRPIAMAQLLAAEGGVSDTHVLCAALLHDTLEDTQTSAAELEREFGLIISGVVMELTDDTRASKAQRKRRQIERAEHISRRSKVLNLADKIDNLRNFSVDPPPDWPLEVQQEYFDWTKAVIDRQRGVNARLEAIFDEAYAARPA
jgi:guanosine-3',5'-bis(diphosphate) 3'-pyrophosphohydrolase